MSKGMNVLHSHSIMEREDKKLAKDKRHVIIDAEYKNLFNEHETEPYVVNNRMYYKVPTLSFIDKGGVFKALKE